MSIAEFLIIHVIHVAFFSVLWRFCNNKGLIGIASVLLLQTIGVDIFVYFYLGHGDMFGFAGLALVAMAFINVAASQKLVFKYAGKEYSGMRLYALLMSTNMKIILGLFLASLYLNLFNPMPPVRERLATNLTAVIPMFVGVFLCRGINENELRSSVRT